MLSKLRLRSRQSKNRAGAVKARLLPPWRLKSDQINREPRRVPVRKRIQQHAIDQAEDCCCGANTQRNDQGTEQVESRIAAEQAQPIDEVSHKGHIENGRKIEAICTDSSVSHKSKIMIRPSSPWQK